ncbi:MAG: hypothetical protein WCF43_10705 [Steroidobacteraceae bacterium]
MILRRVIEHVKAQHWTAVAIDFVIVVAGILIAFQITAWNDARRERIRERDYLVRIAAELDRSIESIGKSIRRSQEREDYGRFLIRSVNDLEIVRADPGRFVKAVAQAGFTLSPAIRGHTFDEIKASGDLGIFRDKALVFDLSEFYTDVPVADALAVRERMLQRPDFIEWLPTAANRVDDAWTYGKWLEVATALRDRIRSTPGVDERLATPVVAP